MGELNYPEHHHPHGIDKPENPQRVWVCDECMCVFSDEEAREAEDGWGHRCKDNPKVSGMRCESHLESYLPELK